MGSKTRLSSYCTKQANNGVNLVTSRKINTRLARPIVLSFITTVILNLVYFSLKFIADLYCKMLVIDILMLERLPSCKVIDDYIMALCVFNNYISCGSRRIFMLDNNPNSYITSDCCSSLTISPTFILICQAKHD